MPGVGFHEFKDVDGSVKWGKWPYGCEGIDLVDSKTSGMLLFGRSDLMGAKVLGFRSSRMLMVP